MIFQLSAEMFLAFSDPSHLNLVLPGHKIDKIIDIQLRLIRIDRPEHGLCREPQLDVR